jgi:hypothetical protein
VSIAERYVELALRLGRHVDGLVDGYHGPPALQSAVDAEPLREAQELREDAQVLLAELEASDYEPQRRRWLAGQLGGLECVAQMAAGEEVPWREAVRRCYGIEVEPVPEERFAAAHARLDAVLAGNGDVAERLRRWHASQEVPGERLLEIAAVLVDELRPEANRIVALPEGEELALEPVTAQPWLAYNWYLGGLRSRIEIVTDLPVRSYYLAALVAHECYPGHHTEHACKEAHLVRGRGWPEASILLIHTPECLVSEGIAQHALEAAFGEEWPARVAAILHPRGIPFDAETAPVVLEVLHEFEHVDVNVALHVAEDGLSTEEAVSYHRRWGLAEEERARKKVGFDTHPVWGIYVPTYAYGHELVRAYARRDAGGFARLLTEELTTADLL